MISQLDNSKNSPNEKQQFWQLQIAELRTLYQKKWLTATAYLYGIVKILRRDGWWLRFNFKEFAIEYGFTKTSLYRAMTTLATDPDISFEWSAQEIRVRFGESEPSDSQKSPETIEKSLGHSQQGELVPHVEQNSQTWNEIPKLGTSVPNLEQPLPETQSQQSVQLSNRYLTDNSQINSDNALAGATPLPHPDGNGEFFKKEEEPKVERNNEGALTQNKELQPVNSLSVVQQSQDSQSQESDNERSKILAELYERYNNSQELTFSGTPMRESLFIAYYQAQHPKIERPAAYIRACLAKGDEGSAEIMALYERWKADCRKAGRKIASSTEIAQANEKALLAAFANWTSDRHEMLVSQYKSARADSSISLENFVAGNSVWLQWVNANHPEWLAVA